MENKNDFIVDGVLYAKNERTWENKTKMTNGSFYYYVLEIATPKRWTTEDGKEKNVTKKELVKFLLPRGFNPDQFDIGDHVTVSFVLAGNEWDKKDGSPKNYFNEIKAENIRFTDITRQGRSSQVFPERTTVVPQNDDDLDTEALPF